MFVKVIFHGILKTLCPDEYSVDANTPAEAIRGVTNQLRDKLIRKDGSRFLCVVKECPNQIQLTSGIRGDELNIYPAFCASGGGSRGGLITMALGAALFVVGVAVIAAGVLLGNPAIAAAGVGMIDASVYIMAGGALMTLAGMFTPKLDTAKATDNPDSSKTFGNNGNTTKIGTRIPIGYGLYKVAGQYLSVNTQAVDRNGGVSSGFAN